MEPEISEDQIINKEIFKGFEDEITCSICLKLLRDPTSCSKCETCFCKTCIEEWMKKNNSCTLKCTPLELKDINISQRKILNKINIKCLNGCSVPLLDYYNHIKTCSLEKNKEVTCWNCSKVCKESEIKMSLSDVEELKQLKVSNCYSG